MTGSEVAEVDVVQLLERVERLFCEVRVELRGDQLYDLVSLDPPSGVRHRRLVELDRRVDGRRPVGRRPVEPLHRLAHVDRPTPNL